MSEIEDRLRKGARAIYLATESIVADDVSDIWRGNYELSVRVSDSLRAQLAEAVGLLGRVVAVADRETDEFIAAREFIERVGE